MKWLRVIEESATLPVPTVRREIMLRMEPGTFLLDRDRNNRIVLLLGRVARICLRANAIAIATARQDVFS